MTEPKSQSQIPRATGSVMVDLASGMAINTLTGDVLARNQEELQRLLRTMAGDGGSTPDPTQARRAAALENALRRHRMQMEVGGSR